MKKIFLLALLLLFVHQISMAQNNTYSKEAFVKGTDTLLYRLLLPENFDPAKKYPVLFFLHGAGERGNNNEAQLLHGGDLFQSERMRKDFPAIVVVPQCPRDDFWANVQIRNTGERFGFQKGGEPGKAMSMLTELVEDYRDLKYADKKQFYVGCLVLTEVDRGS